MSSHREAPAFLELSGVGVTFDPDTFVFDTFGASTLSIPISGPDQPIFVDVTDGFGREPGTFRGYDPHDFAMGPTDLVFGDDLIIEVFNLEYTIPGQPTRSSDIILWNSFERGQEFIYTFGGDPFPVPNTLDDFFAPFDFGVASPIPSDRRPDAFSPLLPGDFRSSTILVPDTGPDPIIGTGVNDVLVGTDEGEDIEARGGKDEVRAGGGDDNVSGGAGNDLLQGEGGDDTLNGGKGNDTIKGGSGANQVNAGPGRDKIEIGGDGGTINGGPGRDEIEFLAEAFTTLIVVMPSQSAIGRLSIGSQAEVQIIGIEDVCGLDGADQITGDGADNSINGKGGNDTLRGGGGNDFLEGAAGNDQIFGNAGGDNIDGGAGRDNVVAGGGSDQVAGGAGNDTLKAGSGSDLVFGNAGRDSIEGGAGNDTLNGGGGNDTIKGGAGKDLITAGSKAGNSDLVFGGANADTFQIFPNLRATVTIADLQSADTILSLNGVLADFIATGRLVDGDAVYGRRDGFDLRLIVEGVTDLDTVAPTFADVEDVAGG